MGDFTRSSSARKPAASIIGIDMRKEKRAASLLSILRDKPPLIVAPDREIPGKMARI